MSDNTGWKKEFDELWPGLWTSNQLLGVGKCDEQVKNFIESLIKKEREEVLFVLNQKLAEIGNGTFDAKLYIEEIITEI